MNVFFLLVSGLGAWCTYNVWRPIYRPRIPAAISFFAGWLYGELGLHHIAWQALATIWFARHGGLDGVSGKLALLITVASWVGLWRWYWRADATDSIFESALTAALGAGYREKIQPELTAKFPKRVDWNWILRPFPMRHPEVERVADIKYSRVGGLNLKLDVYRHRSHPENCPVLFQIHGGGWVIGSKNEQGLPLMLHMAARGWVCVSVDYRLSPHATFPDHLVDLKRALEWVRSEGVKYGANPDFIVATGGSAGGHLTALVGLTQNDPQYQPGFEAADTSVRACLPFYGVYDLSDRDKTMAHDGLKDLLETKVMKASVDEAPEAYEKASPMAIVHAAAPPMMIVHGGCDGLVPVADARQFAERLRAVSKNPVVYVELPEAQHAFEIFPTLRAMLSVYASERFLAYEYSQYLAQREAHGADDTPAQATA